MMRPEVANPGLDSFVQTVDEEETARRFEELRKEWKSGTQFTSSMTELLMHPAYQQIIGMGPAALPHLTRALRERQDVWFWALQSITGETPLPEPAEHTFQENVDAWLEWGRKYGF